MVIIRTEQTAHTHKKDEQIMEKGMQLTVNLKKKR